MGHPLARPFTIFGLGDVMHFGNEAVMQWLERDGQEFKGRKRPKGYRRGKPNNCYPNSAQEVLGSYMVLGKHGTLRYAEGLAYHKDNKAFALFHAWIVDGEGQVIDLTLKKPEEYTYFGVIHDSEDLRQHVVKTRTWGIIGGDDKAAAEWLEAKGFDPRAIDPRWAEVWERVKAMPDPNTPEPEA